MQYQSCRRELIAALLLISVFLTHPILVRAAEGDTPVTPPVAPSAPTASPAVQEKPDVIGNSVVKIFATIQRPDVYKPWIKQSPSDITGSGVVIEGKRILTNAHVALYASQLQVQASQAGDKISATVEAIAPGIDLAVLKLDDEKFFDSHPPLIRAKALPEIKDSVTVYGFPKGGDSLSITKGIVSRIEFASYNFPVSGLRIQIDAAINPGNSGGPAVADDKMIGLAFSTLNESQNIGYIIPNEEIELFLEGIAGGHYHGKPAMFDEYQTLENAALRPFLKIDKEVEGIIISRPFNSDSSYPLKKWDIITKIGETPVDDQGLIKLRENIHINFNYMIQKVAKAGKVPLTVIRDGKEIKIDLPVSSDRLLVMPWLRGTYPPYFVYGPVVFTEASNDFADGFLRTDSNIGVIRGFLVTASPLFTRHTDKPAFEGERLVVVSSHMFPHKLSQGYSDPQFRVLKSVNGIPIRNLEHLVEVLRDSREEFITFEFVDRFFESLVFPRAEILSATDGILTDNGIRNQGSPDMLAIWNAKPSK